ncbi:MAG: hypothetical protein IPP35_09750 [Elusimicrobia bacterium]|nr:hypothetical protein [Elusimicrobiota bacterium]
MENLIEKLKEAELQELVNRSVDLRAGKVSHNAYHSFLRGLCGRNGLSLARYPALTGYMRYVADAEEIDRADLEKELTDLETSAQDALAKTPDQRKLVILSRDAIRLKKLFANEMRPGDWVAYQGRRAVVLDFPSRLKALAPTALVHWPTDLPGFLAPFEAFCGRAMDRNAALIDRLLEKMALEKQSVAVLVAGGFHTDGLMETLVQRGASVAVLTPKIGPADPTQRYLDAFAQDPLPIEEIFSGEPISLKKPCGLATEETTSRLQASAAAFSLFPSVLSGKEMGYSLREILGFAREKLLVLMQQVPGLAKIKPRVLGVVAKAISSLTLGYSVGGEPSRRENLTITEDGEGAISLQGKNGAGLASWWAGVRKSIVLGFAVVTGSGRRKPSAQTTGSLVPAAMPGVVKWLERRGAITAQAIRKAPLLESGLFSLAFLAPMAMILMGATMPGWATGGVYGLMNAYFGYKHTGVYRFVEGVWVYEEKASWKDRAWLMRTRLLIHSPLLLVALNPLLGPLGMLGLYALGAATSVFLHKGYNALAKVAGWPAATVGGDEPLRIPNNIEEIYPDFSTYTDGRTTEVASANIEELRSQALSFQSAASAADSFAKNNGWDPGRSTTWMMDALENYATVSRATKPGENLGSEFFSYPAGWLTVHIHGSPTGFSRKDRTSLFGPELDAPVSAEDLAEIILAQLGDDEKNNKSPILLVSCRSGGELAFGANVAQQISKILNRPVVAPTDTLLHMRSFVIVKDHNSNQGSNEWTPGGRWKLFLPNEAGGLEKTAAAVVGEMDKWFEGITPPSFTLDSTLAEGRARLFKFLGWNSAPASPALNWMIDRSVEIFYAPFREREASRTPWQWFKDHPFSGIQRAVAAVGLVFIVAAVPALVAMGLFFGLDIPFMEKALAFAFFGAGYWKYRDIGMILPHMVWNVLMVPFRSITALLGFFSPRLAMAVPVFTSNNDVYSEMDDIIDQLKKVRAAADRFSRSQRTPKKGAVDVRDIVTDYFDALDQFLNLQGGIRRGLYLPQEVEFVQKKFEIVIQRGGLLLTGAVLLGLIEYDAIQTGRFKEAHDFLKRVNKYSHFLNDYEKEQLESLPNQLRKQAVKSIPGLITGKQVLKIASKLDLSLEQERWLRVYVDLEIAGMKPSFQLMELVGNYSAAKNQSLWNGGMSEFLKGIWSGGVENEPEDNAIVEDLESIYGMILDENPTEEAFLAKFPTVDELANFMADISSRPVRLVRLWLKFGANQKEYLKKVRKITETNIAPMKLSGDFEDWAICIHPDAVGIFKTQKNVSRIVRELAAKLLKGDPGALSRGEGYSQRGLSRVKWGAEFQILGKRFDAEKKLVILWFGTARDAHQPGNDLRVNQDVEGLVFRRSDTLKLQDMQVLMTDLSTEVPPAATIPAVERFIRGLLNWRAKAFPQTNWAKQWVGMNENQRRDRIIRVYAPFVESFGLGAAYWILNALAPAVLSIFGFDPGLWFGNRLDVGLYAALNLIFGALHTEVYRLGPNPGEWIKGPASWPTRFGIMATALFIHSPLLFSILNPVLAPFSLVVGNLLPVLLTGFLHRLYNDFLVPNWLGRQFKLPALSVSDDSERGKPEKEPITVEEGDEEAWLSILVEAFQNGRLNAFENYLPAPRADIQRELERIAQSVAKEKINSASRVMPFREIPNTYGMTMRAFEHPLLSNIVIKVARENRLVGGKVDFAREVLSGYKLAKDRLGGIFALMVLDVHDEETPLHIAGDLLNKDYIIIQERVKPLEDILSSIERPAERATVRAEFLKRIKEDLFLKMSERGVVETDSDPVDNLLRNYGMNSHGKIVGFDVDGLETIESRKAMLLSEGVSGEGLKEIEEMERAWKRKGKSGNQFHRVRDLFLEDVRDAQRDYLRTLFAKKQLFNSGSVNGQVLETKSGLNPLVIRWWNKWILSLFFKVVGGKNISWEMAQFRAELEVNSKGFGWKWAPWTEAPGLPGFALLFSAFDPSGFLASGLFALLHAGRAPPGEARQALLVRLTRQLIASWLINAAVLYAAPYLVSLDLVSPLLDSLGIPLIAIQTWTGILLHGIHNAVQKEEKPDEVKNLARSAALKVLANKLRSTLLGGPAGPMKFDLKRTGELTRRFAPLIRRMGNGISNNDLRAGVAALTAVEGMGAVLKSLEAQLDGWAPSSITEEIYSTAGAEWAQQFEGPLPVAMHDFESKAWTDDPNKIAFFRGAMTVALRESRPVVIAAKAETQDSIRNMFGLSNEAAFWNAGITSDNKLDAKKFAAFAKSDFLLAADLETILNGEGLTIFSYVLVSKAISDEITHLTKLLQQA